MNDACKYLLAVSCLLCGCSEFTKLIPAGPQTEIPGFEIRDFSSTNDGRSLAGDPLVGLGPAVEASRESFLQIGEEHIAQELQEMAAQSAALQNALGSGNFQSALLSIRTPSRASSPTLQARLAEWQKTKVQTNVINALTNDEPALLISRSIWPTVTEQSPPSGLSVLRTPNSVYRGLSRDFDPRRLTASEAGIEIAQQQTAPDLVWQSTIHRTVYARSIQPGNEFQVAVQCSQVTFLSPDGEILESTWPRILLREESGPPELQGPSKREVRGIFRLNLIYRNAEESGQSPTLDAGPISNDLFVVRSASTASIRIQLFLFDGAQSGVSHSLFHEAKDLFLLRFATSRRTSQEITHLWASYRIPFARLIAGVTEQRSDLGLTRSQFADEQAAYLAEGAGFDTPEGFPDDKWVRLDALKAFDDRKRPVAPSLVSNTNGYGIHEPNPQSLSASSNFSYFFKDLEQTTPGSETAERHILDKEDYDTLGLFCKRILSKN